MSADNVSSEGLDQLSNFSNPVQNGFNNTAPIPRGIPNFNSSSMFGKTSDLKRASQYLIVAAVAAVTLRLFSRKRFKTRFWWDDGCAVLASVLLVTNQCMFSALEVYGRTSFAFLQRQDVFTETRRVGRIVAGLKLSLGVEVLYLLSIYLVKFSMLFLYDRFAKHTRHITLYLRVTQIICAVTFAACMLSLFLSCVPVSNFWNPFNTNTNCTRRMLLTYVSGISNIITNTLVLAVPVPLLLRASLTTRQTIGVSVLYFFGLGVVAASALRFVTQLLDVSVPQAIGWSQIEISLAMLLACAPMTAKLLLHPLEQPERLKDCDIDTITLIKQLQMEKKARSGMMKARVPFKEKFGAPSPRDAASFPGDIKPQFAEAMGATTNLKSPDFQRLRVVRAEINGQSVWEVRPATPDF